MTGSVFAKAVLVAGCGSVCLLEPRLHAQTVDVVPLLAGIEKRYNATQTLEVVFSETYTARARKRTGQGTLILRKPGKMRWQYTDGNLFISDGEFIYSYFPEEKRAEKMKFKEAEDMRAPLAFLLGKLDFQRDFRQFNAAREGLDARIVAIPKSDKLPYSEVSFLATPEFVIRRLVVKNYDNSTLQFDLSEEKRNTPAPDSLFRFAPPAGATLVEGK